MAHTARLVVVMGVSGCGKSTVGNMLAKRLKAEFLEGDELHPPRNVERMTAGIALTDSDRRDWLLAIAQQLADAHAAGHDLVVSCSALKLAYRNTLRGASNLLAFVHLSGSADLFRQRLENRSGHYMPASLLESQLQALEPPTAAEPRTTTLDATLAAATLAEQAATWLLALPPPAAKGKR